MEKIILRSIFILIIVAAFAANVHAQWQQLPGPFSGGGGSYASLTHNNGYILTVGQDGIYLSTDSGNSWQISGLRDTITQQVVRISAPSSDVFIVNGTSNLSQQSQGYYLLRSLDSGKTWTSLGDTQGIFPIVLHDTLLESLFHSPDSSVIRFSVDYGSTWSDVPKSATHFKNIGTPSLYTACNNYVFGLLNDTELVRWSMQGGLDSLGLPYNPQIFALTSTDNALIAGLEGEIAVSTDFGLHWTVHPVTSGDSIEFYTVAAKGDTILVGNSWFTSRSTDGGNTWYEFGATNGFPNTGSIQSFEYEGGWFWAQSDAGIYRSSDGANWVRANGGINEASIFSLAVDSGILYAAAVNGIYHSTDQGETWSVIQGNSDLQDIGATSLSVENGQLYPSGNGFWISQNHGDWYNPSDMNIENAAYDSGVWYGSVGWYGVVSSSDGGLIWQDITGDLPVGYGTSAYTNFVIPAFGNLFAIQDDGTYIADDGGMTWTLLPNVATLPGGGPYTIFDSCIYIGGSGGGLLRAPYPGLQWNFDSGLMTDLISVVAKYRNNLVVGIGFDPLGILMPGIYISNGIDDIWTQVGQPIDNMSAFTTDNQYAYLATSDDGIWRIPLSYFSSSNVKQQQAILYSLTIFPNPSTFQSAISFSLPDDGPVSIKLYDELGTMRNEIFDGEMDAGQHEIPFTVPNLANGIYEVVLTTETNSSADNLVIDR